jgi:hypothetical protein
VTNLFLFFHLLGAFCFFAGGAVVGVLQLAAIRQERPSQVHALLRLAPVGAALVGAGALLTLGFGIALAEHEGLGLSPVWIQAAFGLWVAAMVLGAFGGRTARHARHLAEKLAAEGDAPSPELRALISARGPLWASYASFVLLLVIVGLMVWQPGSPSRFALLAPLQREIASGKPRIAYVPTRVPAGYSVAGYTYQYSAYEIGLLDNGNYDTEIDFSVAASCSSEKPIWAQQRLKVHGMVVLYPYGEDGHQMWICRNGVLLEAATHDYDMPGRELATVVAYAEPIR